MQLYFQWPQVIWCALALLGLGIHVARHGEPLRGKYSAGGQLLSILIAIALLAWGGFFTPVHAQVPAQAVKYRAELVRAAHSQWGLDAPIAALAAQVHQESGWRPDAVSRVGAAGMAQFMPATSAWWCQLNKLSPAQCQPANPVWALRALAGYDKYLWDRVPARFDAHDRLWVALRGYNGGLGHWQAEAKVAQASLRQAAALMQLQSDTLLPSRQAVDAACGRARRHISHCAENLGYPQRILVVLRPRYAAWSPGA